MVQRFSLRTAPPLKYKGNRVNALYGNSLLSLMSQKQNVLNQWSNAGVERVAKQARQAKRKVKVNNKISDKTLAKLNLDKHKAKVRSFNTITPAHYAPNGYTMGNLGFTYADNKHSKYKYLENGQKIYQCAYTANRLSSRFRRPTAGNAWTTQGIYGDSVLVDGYNQGLNIRPPFYVQPLVDAYNRRAADYVKNHISEHNLQNGDIVGMYTTFSPSQKRAYREGLYRRTNTHTGRVVMGLDGAPFVVHNMHGEVRVDPLSELLGGFNTTGITYISRPNLTPQAEKDYFHNH